MSELYQNIFIAITQSVSSMPLPIPPGLLFQTAAANTPFDLVSFFTSAGVLGILVFFMWAFLIKDPPLFVTWREHKEALDLIKELNAQLNRFNRVAEKQADKIPEKRTASSYRVAARKRQNGEP